MSIDRKTSDDRQQAVLRLLKREGSARPLGTSDIAYRVGLEGAATRRALEALVKAGKVRLVRAQNPSAWAYVDE